jgi:hypothetical protein
MELKNALLQDLMVLLRTANGYLLQQFFNG